MRQACVNLCWKSDLFWILGSSIYPQLQKWPQWILTLSDNLCSTENFLTGFVIHFKVPISWTNLKLHSEPNRKPGIEVCADASKSNCFQVSAKPLGNSIFFQNYANFINITTYCSASENVTALIWSVKLRIVEFKQWSVIIYIALSYS